MMGVLFDFNRLIGKYSSEFTITFEKEGFFNSMGDYVKGESITKELFGAILSVSQNKIFRSEGAITTNDRQLYIFEPLNELIGARVLYKGISYSVEKDVDNANFTGVNAYMLKHVSAFKEGAND